MKFLSLLGVQIFLAMSVLGQVQAFEWDRIINASPKLIACVEGKVGKAAVAAVLKGEIPKDKKMRKRLKKAYEKCALMTGEAETEDFRPYDGPLFDAMSQIDETVDCGAAIERVRSAGVVHLALFARSRKRLHQSEDLVLKIARKNPDLIVTGAPKYFQLSGDLSQAYIEATIKGIQKHGYSFVGEILYTHGDKKSGRQYTTGERYVDPSKPGTGLFLKDLATMNIPVMTHWEPYAPQRDFPKFHALYAAWPNQKFIVPHMGFASPGQVDEFMGRHPNLYMIISKKDRVMEDFSNPDKQASIGSAMLDGFLLNPEWKKILVRYQDRLLFGSDAHMKKLWLKYPLTIKSYRLLLGQLPVAVAKKIAFENAVKLYKK